MLIWHADRSDFEHARQLGDHVLDFVRIDVEAGDQNHVLLPVDDLDEAVFVHQTDVARLEEAVRGHDLGRLFRSVPVASHHLRAADADFAGLAKRHLVAFIVANRDFGRRQRQADRAAIFRDGDRIAGDAWRRFR